MKGESLKTRLFRFGMNIYPMYFGTGGRVLFIKSDWTHTILRLKLGIMTRNYVGTIFGGSMFAAADPFHMVMLINIIGKDYVVWDKSGGIKFKKPGRGKLKAEIIYSPDEIKTITESAQANGSYEFTKPMNWVDESGQIVSIYEKTVYVATKAHFKERQKARAQAPVS